MPRPASPWLIPYLLDDITMGAAEREARLGRQVVRPAAEVEVRGPKGPQRTWALVDSGSEHTLIAPWMSRATGIQAGPGDPEIEIGLGGGTRTVQLTACNMALLPPPDIDEEPIYWNPEIGIIASSWEPQWGVLLGQVGFFDIFTVTMSRHAQALAIEALEQWDVRFPMPPQEAEEPGPPGPY